MHCQLLHALAYLQLKCSEAVKSLNSFAHMHTPLYTLYMYTEVKRGNCSSLTTACNNRATTDSRCSTVYQSAWHHRNRTSHFHRYRAIISDNSSLKSNKSSQVQWSLETGTASNQTRALQGSILKMFGLIFMFSFQHHE